MLYSKTTLSLIGSLIVILFPWPVNAETTHELYGTLSYGLQKESSNRPNLHYTPELQPTRPSHPHSHPQHNPSKERSHLQPNNKIGIKGEKPIGNGNSIIYQLEWGDEK